MPEFNFLVHLAVDENSMNYCLLKPGIDLVIFAKCLGLKIVRLIKNELLSSSRLFSYSRTDRE
jgi:hypothetical protein